MIEELYHLGCEFLILEAFPNEGYAKLHNLIEKCYSADMSNANLETLLTNHDTLNVSFIASNYLNHSDLQKESFANAVKSYYHQYQPYERQESCTHTEIQDIASSNELESCFALAIHHNNSVQGYSQNPHLLNDHQKSHLLELAYQHQNLELVQLLAEKLEIKLWQRELVQSTKLRSNQDYVSFIARIDDASIKSAVDAVYIKKPRESHITP